MARNRPEPTLADYMAIAIGPALIIVLVGSIAFYLLLVFYSGELTDVTNWTMGCFVVAAVLISRVSIVEGAEKATVYGLALGVVVALAMTRYTSPFWLSWIVLAVIWWFASHLVWNCTLVDDADDASGEGLLEAAGLEGKDSDKQEDAAAETEEKKGRAAKEKPRPKQFPSKKREEAPPPPPPPPIPVWRRALSWWQRGSSRAAPPGIWVIYCSLVALPIFGFGQWFLDSAGRAQGFTWMFRYVASALLLLLTTSFLGLRRYLRQRKLEMPLPMAGVWLGVGGAMVAVILLIATLIPRPNPDFTLASLTGWITSPSRESSRVSPLQKSAVEGESQDSAPAEEKSKDEDPEAKHRGDSEQTSPDGEGKSDGKSSSSAGKTSADGKQQPAGGGEKGEQGKQPGKSQDGKQSSDAGESKSKQGEAGEPQSKGQKSGEQSEKQSDPAGKQQPDAKSEQTPETKAPETQSPEKQSPEKQSPETQAPQEKAQKESEQQKQNEQQKDQQKKQGATRSGKPKSPTKPAAAKGSWTPSFGWLGSLLKFLFYAALAIAVIYFLYRYWDEVRAWLARLWQEVLDIWNSLFGAKRKEEALAAEAAEEAKPQARPFASFKDPFLSGDAARSKPSAVVQYSFEALEAWATERGLGRQPEETPIEFASRLSTEAAALGSDASDLAGLYARVAYARDPLSPASLKNVERLWKTLRTTAKPTAVSGVP